MSGELEALLRLVSEGKLTAEEAAPIVAALESKSGATPKELVPATKRAGARRPRTQWPAGAYVSSWPRMAAP